MNSIQCTAKRVIKYIINMPLREFLNSILVKTVQTSKKFTLIGLMNKYISKFITRV